MKSPVPVPDSHLTKIKSTVLNGEEFELHIHFPGSYTNGDKKYPVIYLMDSQWNFPLLSSLYSQQYYDGFIPEVIIVGVSWSTPDQLNSRVRDFFPESNNEAPQGGGAIDFISFLKSELIPFIESNFRAESTRRTIVGNSASGFLALYLLFSAPDIFTNYITTSPTFDWNNDIIYQYERAYFMSQPDTPSRLFIAIGGVERNVSRFETLVRHLKSRCYKSLKIECRVLENTGHGGSKGEGFSRGLQFIFERNQIKLDKTLLKLYSGTYQFSHGERVILAIENEKLVIYLSAHNRFELIAESNTSFYSKAQFLKINFIVSMGVVDSLILERFEGTQSAKKV